MNVRFGTASDAAVAARLHASSIDEGFLSRLGPRFLTRLYRRIALDDGSFLLLADDGGEPVGMIAGADDVGTLYRNFVRHDAVVAGLLSLPRIVRHAGSVVETWRYGNSGDHALPRAELLATAVATSTRGQGVGRALVEALTSEFQRRNIDQVKVVVGAANQPAIRLYSACGFDEAATIEVHRDVASKVLVWSSPR